MPEAKHEPKAEIPPFQTVNAEELSRNLLRLFEQGGNVLTEFSERNDSKMVPYSAATEITEATNTLSDLGRQWLPAPGPLAAARGPRLPPSPPLGRRWPADPARFAEAQGTLLRSYAELWNNTVRRMFGEEVEPVAEPEPG